MSDCLGPGEGQFPRRVCDGVAAPGPWTDRVQRLGGLWAPPLVAVLAIAVVTLVVCVRVLTGRQFETTDLSPTASASQSLAACALPYERVGLGRPNPLSAPGLCDMAGLAAAVGPLIAQHLFLVGTLIAAGVSAYALLRRIGHCVGLSFVGALLYEFAPPMLDQFGHGGPSILLTGALLPAVVLGFVGGQQRSPYVEACSSAGVLGLIAFFNPQAPLLAILVVTPLLVASIRAHGWAWTLRFAGTFAITFAVAAAPILVTLDTQAAAAGRAVGSLAATVRSGLGDTSARSFVEPYAFLGVVAAIIGVGLLLCRRGTATEVALAWAGGLVMGTWLVFRVAGGAIVSVAPLLGLFRDFIKFQMLLALPIAVLSVRTLRMVQRSSGLSRPFGIGAMSVMVALLFSPLALNNRESVASGYLGLAHAEVPRVYDQVKTAMQTLDKGAQDHRILWVPQDFSTTGILSAYFPTSLVYRSDAPEAARQSVLQSFDAIVRGDEADIGADLGAQSVKYVVLNLAYSGEAGAPWESGARNVAAISGTRVLAGSASAFVPALAYADGLRPIIRTSEYIIYENRYWMPIVQHYNSMLALDSTGALPDFLLDKPVELNWQAGSGVRWRERSDGSVEIDGSSYRSWQPVQATFPTSPGQMYQVSGVLQSLNAAETHVKLVWSGNVPENVNTIFIVHGMTGSGTLPFTSNIVAPSGSVQGTLILMGGWSAGGPPRSTFSEVSLRPLSAPGAVRNVGPRGRAALARELPDLLPIGGTHTQLSGAPSSYITWLGTRSCVPHRPGYRCARLLTAPILLFEGAWTHAALPDTAALEWFTESKPGRVIVPAAAYAGMPAGSKLHWAEYEGGDITNAEPILHDRALPFPGISISMSCLRPGCAIADPMVVEPSIASGGLTRVSEAPDVSLRGMPGGVHPLSVPSTWASVYPGRLNTLPVTLVDSDLIRRWAALIIGNFAVFAGICLGVSSLIRRSRRGTARR